MSVLLKLAENRPNLIANYFDKIKAAAEETPSTVSLAAQILATSGKISKVCNHVLFSAIDGCSI